jgi:hypothetical protein
MVTEPIGEWYIEKGTGRILNGLLSRDLIREVGLGRGLLAIKNGFTAVELGMSPFHFIFEGMETQGSMIGMGLRKLYLSPQYAFKGRGQLAARMAAEGTWDIITSGASFLPWLQDTKLGTNWMSAERVGHHAKKLFAATGNQYGQVQALTDVVAKAEQRLKHMKENTDAQRAAKQLVRDEKAHAEADLQAAQGEYDKAVELYAQTEAGKRFLKAHPEAVESVHDYFQGGGKLHMDEAYRMRASKAFKDSFKEAMQDVKDSPGLATVARAAYNSPMALNELVMSPLFNRYIPNVKLGMFLREFGLTKLENEGTLKRAREQGPLAYTNEYNWLARKTVDFIEDRYGEMNFDNLAWNNTMKTAFQLLLRSVTWKLGNLSASTKAVRGLVRTPENIRNAMRTGDTAALDPALAWAFGMVLNTTLASLTLSTMLGKKDPKETMKKVIGGDMKELVSPVVDEMGTRVTIPSYLRDWEHMYDSGIIKYIASSLSGDIGKAMELKDNKTYYGTEVYHPADPTMHKAKDILLHMFPIPFVGTSVGRLYKEGAPVKSLALSALGFNKAPARVGKSKAQLVAEEKVQATRSPKARTTAEFEHSQLLGKLANMLRRGEDIQPHVNKAMQSGLLAPKDVQTIQKMKSQTPLQRSVTQIQNPDDLLEVYEKASDEERREIYRILDRKFGTIANQTWRTKEDEQLMERIRKVFVPPKILVPATAPPPGSSTIVF